jgi:hypothetical protein
MKKIASFAVCLLVSAFALPAFADETKSLPKLGDVRGDGYTTSDTDNGYSVSFIDDLCKGKNVDASAALIKVRPHLGRAQLIRPRTHFLPELYKTIEDI